MSSEGRPPTVSDWKRRRAPNRGTRRTIMRQAGRVKAAPHRPPSPGRLTGRPLRDTAPFVRSAGHRRPMGSSCGTRPWFFGGPMVAAFTRTLTGPDSDRGVDRVRVVEADGSPAAGPPVTYLLIDGETSTRPSASPCSAIGRLGGAAPVGASDPVRRAVLGAAGQDVVLPQRQLRVLPMPFVQALLALEARPIGLVGPEHGQGRRRRHSADLSAIRLRQRRPSGGSLPTSGGECVGSGSSCGTRSSFLLRAPGVVPVAALANPSTATSGPTCGP